MAKFILFTRRRCSGCHAAKQDLDEEGFSYREVCLDTFDGLGEGAFYNIHVVPTLLVLETEGGRELERYEGSVPSVKHLEGK